MRQITELPRLRPREAEAHKGDFGRVLVVAGSRGMSGAAVLCGTAALKSGAGLVTVACPESIQNVAASGFPCYTTHGLRDDSAGLIRAEASEEACRLANAADVAALGCGLGASAGVAAVVKELLNAVAKPFVVDADALNALAPLDSIMLSARSAETILTPHPGEFARLTAQHTPQTHEQRLDASAQVAKDHRVIVLLKGHRTIVTDGEQYFVNTTGNPGMATGGSGDVLTGLIAALVGQGLSAFDAAALGAHLHGIAGDLAAEAFGHVSMTALDLLNELPRAFRLQAALS